MKNKHTVSGAIIGIMSLIIVSLIFFIVDLDIGVINVLSLITVDSFIIWIYFKIMKFEKEDLKLNVLLKRENLLIILGLVIILVAVSTPFTIMWKNNYEYSLEFFGDLGPVGDFFGGTTVGLLSLASLLFVTAAMFMQKEELELQRKEVTATRKEYEITNQTMKKQSFDSTFFNLISLHQSILSQVKYKEANGREAFESMYVELKQSFKDKKEALWEEVLFNTQFPRKLRDEMIISTCNNSNTESILKEYDDFIDEEKYELSKYYYGSYDHIPGLDDTREILKQMIDNPLSAVPDVDEANHKKIFIFLANNGLLFDQQFNLIELKENALNNLEYEWKKFTYEILYKGCENEIGHYYRNLYRIVKYIQDYEFTNSLDSEEKQKINFREKKNYRAILRAQLSSYELMMLFYNICYSEKGYKFKELLKSTDFFDDHLVKAGFIWLNDENELEYFGVK